MLRALIVDDESHARENLRMMIEENCPDVEIAGAASSAREARSLLNSTDVQALFLDVKMPGEDGFDLLRSLNGRELGVVFTTAYDGYALQAFRENAIDYLEKPIDADHLKRAVVKLSRLAAVDLLADQRHNAVAAISPDPHPPLEGRLAIPGRDGLNLIRHDDIIYLEASDSYTTLHLREGKRTMSSKHIRVFQNHLEGHNFFRVHKSYIVNLSHLKAFSRTEGNMVVLDDGTLIPVSRRRLPEFLGLINSF